MTFTFTNYAALPPQHNPLSNLIGDILSGYTGVTNARYLQPTLEESLKKAKLYNQFYGPNIESEIGLRNAQTGEAGARTGLLGEQTKAAHTENGWLPQKIQAAIAESNAKALKSQMIQQLLNGGQIPAGNQRNPMEMFKGQGMPANSEQISNASQSQPIQDQFNQPSNNGIDYAKAATAMQVLGLGKPQVVDANGRYIAITPFGNIDTGIAGRSVRDTALDKEDAKKISNLENAVLSGSQKQETFNELNKDLASPEFAVLRQNPIMGRHEIAWYERFGTDPQKEMIGRVKTHMGNIIKDASRDFAGQFRIGEQALLNDMKPNVSDSLQTMIGKSEALTYMNEILTMRAEMEASLMRQNNISALEARRAVDKTIDSDKIKEKVRTILHPASSSKSNFNQSDLEYTAKKHNMTVEEVRKRLGGR